MENSNLKASYPVELASVLEPQHQAPGAEYFTSLSAPVTKLDADQYMADDLDGVTESLFGSGNLNFLLMQSGQANDAIALSDPFIITGEAPAAAGGLISGAYFNSSGETTGNAFNFSGPGFSTDRMIGESASSHQDSGIGHAGFTSTTLTSLEASALAINSDTVNPLSGINGYNGTGGDDGTSGKSGIDGINGINGTDGDGTTIINVDNSITVDIGEILIDIDIGDIIVDLGDLTIIDLGDVTNLVTEIVNLTDILNLTEVTNNVTDIVNNLINNIFGGGEGGLTLGLDAVLSDLTSLNLDVLSGDTITNLVNEAIDLSPATNLLDPLIGSTDLGLVDLHSLLSIMDGHNEHNPGDTDLGVGLIGNLEGLNVLDGVTDAVFDPIEDLAGDVDILADLGLDLFNADTSAGDTDLTLGLDLDFADTDLLDLGMLDGLPVGDLVNNGLLDIAGGDLGVNLDLVENILGDIDLDLGIATDLLGDTADDIADSLMGGSGEDTLATGVGDLLGDTGSDLVDGNLAGILDGDVLDNLPVDDLLGQITDVLDGDVLGNLPGSDILDGGIADILGGQILQDLPLGDIADNGLVDIFDGNIPGGVPGGDILGGIADALDGGITDIPGGLLGDSGDAPDVQTDIDLGLLGNDFPDIQEDALLDVIEPATGDIDLDLGAGLDLLGDNETDNNTGDSDLSTDLDIDIAGIELPDIDFIDVPLDPLENVLGDIDLDINGAINLLNANASDGGVADLPGGNAPGEDVIGWTENILPDAGDISGGLGDALGSVLPDPVGGIAEGLGSLLGGNDHQPHHGGLFGGLFG
jgi:hypothetical protein